MSQGDEALKQKFKDLRDRLSLPLPSIPSLEESGFFQPPSRDDIIRLAALNPSLYALWAQWHRRDITWEQAMYGMIVALASENERLKRTLVQERMCEPVKVFSVDELGQPYERFTFDPGRDARAGDAGDPASGDRDPDIGCGSNESVR